MCFDIVIPTHGENSRLRRTLAALARCDELYRLKSIIVVENGVKFNAEGVCTEFSSLLNIKYVHELINEVVRARNIGVSYSASDFLIFLDDDIEVNKNYLKSYFDGVSEFGVDCFYGGAIYPDYEIKPPEWLMPFLPWSAKEYVISNQKKLVNEPIFLGGNFCVPRQALSLAGGFEGPGATGRNQGGVGEENRLQARLLSIGLKAYWLPDAAGLHWVPRNKCDKQFIINRSFRHGFTDAINDNKYYSLIGSVPRWIYKSLLISQMQLIRKKIFGAMDVDIFKKRIYIARLKGLIHGFKSKD